ncbi:hypothetical protein [Streptomyces sp. NPDC056921]|uniref:hypothetical protein n=1 Tax=Streptomyces sp. NPDC056921 TaxID=3345966 RepID=UPI00362C9C27
MATISASQLTEGNSILIRGKLGFAVLTRLIQGAELAASDQRKVQNGMSPIGKPHITATIVNAGVQFADPSNPTLEEQFVSERRYSSKKNPDSGPNYSIDCRSSTLPIIAIPSATGDGTYDQDESGQELAQGLDVTLVLRVYKPKNFNNRGLALDQVIVHEEPRYYNAGGVNQAELAARGIVLNGAPRPIQAALGDAAGAPVGTEVEDGLSFPAPQPTTATVTVQVPAQDQATVAQPTAVAAPVAVAVAAPASAVAPASTQEETMEEKLARLEAENDSLRDMGSSVGAPVVTGSSNAGTAQQAGITYQG